MLYIEGTPYDIWYACYGKNLLKNCAEIPFKNNAGRISDELKVIL